MAKVDVDDGLFGSLEELAKKKGFLSQECNGSGSLLNASSCGLTGV
jgi:hypothetical protein